MEELLLLIKMVSYFLTNRLCVETLYVPLKSIVINFHQVIKAQTIMHLVSTKRQSTGTQMECGKPPDGCHHSLSSYLKAIENDAINYKYTIVSSPRQQPILLIFFNFLTFTTFRRSLGSSLTSLIGTNHIIYAANIFTIIVPYQSAIVYIYHNNTKLQIILQDKYHIIFSYHMAQIDANPVDFLNTLIIFLQK